MYFPDLERKMYLLQPIAKKNKYIRRWRTCTYICLPDSIAAKLCELGLVEVNQSSIFLVCQGRLFWSVFCLFISCSKRDTAFVFCFSFVCFILNLFICGHFPDSCDNQTLKMKKHREILLNSESLLVLKLVTKARTHYGQTLQPLRSRQDQTPNVSVKWELKVPRGSHFTFLVLSVKLLARCPQHH